jgi:hypothetical protein
VAATDDVVEQEADENPSHVVQRRRKTPRRVTDATKDNREVEVLEKRQVKLLVESPLDKWGNSTGQDEYEAVVQLFTREDTLRANDPLE